MRSSTLIFMGFVITFLLDTTAYALDISGGTHTSLVTSCEPLKAVEKYVKPDVPLNYPADDYYSTFGKDGIISSNSEVSVYNPNNKMSVAGPWKLTTNYFPGPGTYTVLWSQTPMVVNFSNLVPSDRGKVLLQITYKIKRMFSGNNNTYNYNGEYYYLKSDSTNITQLGNLNKSFDPSTVRFETECYNVSIRWCGDGVIDSGDGEQCDAGSENGKPGSGCDASCKPINNPPPVCASALNGKDLPNPITAGQCDVGTPSGFTKVMSGSTEVYSWKCDGNGSVSCSARYTPTTNLCGNGVKDPGEQCDPNDPKKEGWGSGGCDASCKPINNPPPVCASALNGKDLPNPITAGQCDVGTPSGFTKVMSGSTEVYSWKCDGNGSVSCSARYTPQRPNLEIKKYAKSISTGDSQNSGSAVSLSPGEYFNYYYVAKVTGSGVIKGAIVKDTFPQYIELTGSITAPAGWTCTKGTQVFTGETIARYWLVCKTDADIPAGTTLNFTIPAYVSMNIPRNTPLQNVVYICEEKLPDGKPNPACTETPPPPPKPNCEELPPEERAKDPACVIVVGPSLEIKKYAKTIQDGDSQNSGSAVSLSPGEYFNYYYVAKVTGSGVIKGAIVKDTFPQYIELTGSITAPAGWTCTKGTQVFTGETIARHWLVCKTDADIPAGTTLNFTIPAYVSMNIPRNTPLQNVVYICEEKLPDGKPNPACTETPPPPPKPNCEELPPEERAKDPACVIVSSFDLALKKYINSDDAQNAPGPRLTTGTNFNYILRVQNIGGDASTGTTKVQDILPVGVERTGNPTGTNWSCTVDGVKTTCTSTQGVSANGFYPDITIPVRVTATAGQTILNIAAVDNPFEGNRCKTDGTLPSTASEYCNKDSKNSDPAYFNVGGGDGGGQYFYIQTCIGPTPVCAIRVYNSKPGCESIEGRTCYTELNTCNINNTLICSGGSGYCGDGVLQAGEECDLGNGNGTLGGACDASCRITKDSFTTPGENPILDIWVRIPNLSASKLGIGFINYYFRTNPYRIVVGKDTPLFTNADSVLFGVTQKYDIPLLLDVNRNFCLEANDTAVVSEGGKAACVAIGTAASNYRNSDGRYVALGKGEYFIPRTCYSTGCVYDKFTVDNRDEILLFKGGSLYDGLTLRDRFKGGSGVGGISLTSNGIDLVSIPVRISSAFASNTAGGTAYMRSVQITLSTDKVVADFLANLAKGNFTTTVIGNANVTGGVTGGSTTTISTSGSVIITTNVAQGDRVISNCPSDLSLLTPLNGNNSILVVNGNLTINCDLTLTGIRTILIQRGNLILNGNISYEQNNTGASWAFIVERGDIEISPNTRNLAGVFVTTGRYTQNSATANILRIDGSLYGNASDLISKRTYVRGNNAYDILTSGTIINYSNRAFINPPPLLSQYLNNYNIQRVAQ